MTALDHTFTATLEKSPAKGGWTFVVMPAFALAYLVAGPPRAGGPTS